MQCANTLKYHLNFIDIIVIINNNKEEPQSFTTKNIIYDVSQEEFARLRGNVP
jgi:hypothetical protein